MLTSNIKFKVFEKSKKKSKIIKIFNEIKKNLNDKSNLFFLSLTNKYNYSFNKKDLKKYKNFSNYRLIGMGGSSLGAKAIYSFLRSRIKKKFEFLDNIRIDKLKKSKSLNIVISKSGNTLETISNFNSLDNVKNSIFLSEYKSNYLKNVSNELNKEIFEHKDYIGGRYSVLSETGMLPACLMGLDYKKFKRLDYLIGNKIFQKQLILNVSSILDFHNKKKTNSIILNYDEGSQELFFGINN